MAGQIVMLIECPNCFALMRGRANYCRRCGRALATAVISADKPNPTPAKVKKNVRLARFFCVIGMGLLLWGISDGSVDRSVLGGFLLIVGIAGYFQERKRAVRAGELRYAGAGVEVRHRPRI